MKKLSDRLNALEAIRQPPPTPAPIKSKWLTKILMRDLEQEDRDYKMLDAAGRIRYWERVITDAEALVARGNNYDDEDNFEDHSVTGRLLRSMRDHEPENEAQELLGQYPFDLTDARLDRLQELSYNSVSLNEWRKVHENYRTIPWQWRREYLDLPADALKVIQAN